MRIRQSELDAAAYYVTIAVMLFGLGAIVMAALINAGPARAGERCGLASWYGPGFHGRRTASGERFDQHALTVAHRSHRFGTMLRIVDPASGKAVVARVTDRGPFARGRVVDLSRASAERLGIRARGVGRVCIEQVRARSPPHR